MFDQVAAKLIAEDSLVVKSQMFGMPTLKIAGKAFAGSFEEDMVFKLGGGDHAKALGVPSAHLFDPMGGRPMKEWVVVPADQSGAWIELAEHAKAYVLTQVNKGK